MFMTLLPQMFLLPHLYTAHVFLLSHMYTTHVKQFWLIWAVVIWPVILFGFFVSASFFELLQFEQLNITPPIEVTFKKEVTK